MLLVTSFDCLLWCSSKRSHLANRQYLWVYVLVTVLQINGFWLNLLTAVIVTAKN